MKKAKYIGKWVDTSYGQCIIHLEYEYRGHRYEVTENRRKGNTPLSWQHENEQGRIDELIEMENKPKNLSDMKTLRSMALNCFGKALIKGG